MSEIENNKISWITKYNKENNNEYKNYVFSGKYLAILLPNHHMARKDGYVYIHQLQAEKKLGRKLKKSECVHHIDENKYNNEENNLMVFKTIADHTAFHNGAEIYLEGDVWVACPNKNLLCPICNKNYKDHHAKMCKSCYLKQVAENIPPKDDLIKLLLTIPMTKIGETFGVSDNAVRKWCKKYKLPFKRKEIAEFRNLNFIS